MNYARMEEQLILHEGLKLTPYLDSEGFWTVGVGYNVSARGWQAFEQVVGRPVSHLFDPEAPQPLLTRDEALRVLRADIARVEQAVRTYLPEYDTLDDVRQRVVVDLAFNLAYRALGFKRAIAALKRRDWSGVARELWDSRWSRQVGDGPGKKRDRADRLTQMVLTGHDYVGTDIA